jgi:hypothetical protein
MDFGAVKLSPPTLLIWRPDHDPAIEKVKTVAQARFVVLESVNTNGTTLPSSGRELVRTLGCDSQVVEMLDEGVAEDLYKIGADWPSIISPPRLRWLKRHERAWPPQEVLS